MHLVLDESFKAKYVRQNQRRQVSELQLIAQNVNPKICNSTSMWLGRLAWPQWSFADVSQQGLIFLLKSTPCWLTSAKLHHWGHTRVVVCPTSSHPYCLAYVLFTAAQFQCMPIGGTTWVCITLRKFDCIINFSKFQ